MVVKNNCKYYINYNIKSIFKKTESTYIYIYTHTHTHTYIKGYTLWIHPKYNLKFNSVAQSCPTLCDSMDRSTPGLPVHHQLLEFTIEQLFFSAAEKTFMIWLSHVTNFKTWDLNLLTTSSSGCRHDPFFHSWLSKVAFLSSSTCLLMLYFVLCSLIFSKSF